MIGLACHLFGWEVSYVMGLPVRTVAVMVEDVLDFKSGSTGRTETAAEELLNALRGGSR